MDKNKVTDLAQQLVDLEIQLRALEEDKLLIKLDLWENARGGIKCQGGTVFWAEPGTESRFNLKKLTEVLIEAGLSDTLIKNILDDCRVESQRYGNVKVRLDK